MTDPDFCGRGDSIPNDIFVDFESAKPLPDEEELYNEIEELLATSDKLLNDLNNYQGTLKVNNHCMGDSSSYYCVFEIF